MASVETTGTADGLADWCATTRSALLIVLDAQLNDLQRNHSGREDPATSEFAALGSSTQMEQLILGQSRLAESLQELRQAMPLACGVKNLSDFLGQSSKYLFNRLA